MNYAASVLMDNKKTIDFFQRKMDIVLTRAAGLLLTFMAPLLHLVKKFILPRCLIYKKSEN